MNLRASIVVAIMAGCAVPSSQDRGDQELARQLANASTRQSAVAKILASGSAKIVLLLSWTLKPPAQVDKYELYIGLADALGQLRAREAIPFLIDNIGLRRTREVDLAPWLKTDQVIEWTFPAVAALIQIGPDASKALIRASRRPMVAEHRIAVIFAVSRIRDVPEARTFLTQALGMANIERYWAEEGLELSKIGR